MHRSAVLVAPQGFKCVDDKGDITVFNRYTPPTYPSALVTRKLGFDSRTSSHLRAPFRIHPGSNLTEAATLVRGLLKTAIPYTDA